MAHRFHLPFISPSLLNSAPENSFLSGPRSDRWRLLGHASPLSWGKGTFLPTHLVFLQAARFRALGRYGFSLSVLLVGTSRLYLCWSPNPGLHPDRNTKAKDMAQCLHRTSLFSSMGRKKQKQKQNSTIFTATIKRYDPMVSIKLASSIFVFFF